MLSHFVLSSAIYTVARRHVQRADGEQVCSERCTNYSKD